MTAPTDSPAPFVPSSAAEREAVVDLVRRGISASADMGRHWVRAGTNVDAFKAAEDLVPPYVAPTRKRRVVIHEKYGTTAELHSKLYESFAVFNAKGEPRGTELHLAAVLHNSADPQQSAHVARQLLDLIDNPTEPIEPPPAQPVQLRELTDAEMEEVWRVFVRTEGNAHYADMRAAMAKADELRSAPCGNGGKKVYDIDALRSEAAR